MWDFYISRAELSSSKYPIMKPKLFIIAGMAFAASIGTVSPQKNKKSELTADTGKVILNDTLSLQNNNFAQTVKVGLNKNVSDMAEIPTWLRVFGAVLALSYLAGFLLFIKKIT